MSSRFETSLDLTSECGAPFRRGLVRCGAALLLGRAIKTIGIPGRTIVIVGRNVGSSRAAENALATISDEKLVIPISGSVLESEYLSEPARLIGNQPIGCIVAIGGGRTIDLGKLLACGIRDTAAARAVIRGDVNARRNVPLIALPTTAGSGSECTPFAVVYDQGRKASIENISLVPDVSLVDARFLASAPASVNAVAGLDALCQAIESLLSKFTTPESSVRARRALLIASQYLRRAVAGETSAQRAMAIAGHLAGQAIAITRTTIPHALSYNLSYSQGIPHGHAVSLSMGRYLELFGSLINSSAKLGVWRAPYGLIESALGASQKAPIAKIWGSLLDELGLAPTAKDCGLSMQDIHKTVDLVDLARMANSPVKLDRSQLIALFD
ncbi:MULTISPECIES: iron-containing alcohol dehydrogenase [unclassified Neorhizobium]|uniref:iron-containing alcohol dehydrogenase n=1 Tax=unclassified Neorhizobium TaxID=2629175 RepID=UPI001FF32ED8|nr:MULTISPECIES: iron-containing alcohol dehydrogenase [unclassified Neorhizobium]MCJ9668983.1 iron-containing alcohol dehydrogenase [Neorhizobium sp. SHOUNA12B]MCJ9744937.1 iron-containing alcohol dehydrogenase [Neorhizobium sp. SHOUNA12A]